MKRPLLVLCAAVLSGTLMGIAETEVIVRVTVAAATVAALLMAYIKSRDRSTILLFCTLFFVLFFSSFLRARAVSNRYGKEPAAAFFEQYRAANPGEFDYALYLKSQNITNEEEREKQKEDHGLQILSAKCESIFDRNLTRHDAGIFKAIVLGRKESMDEDIKNLYQKSGIAHLLTVSGLHISMIGMGTFQFLRKKLVCPPVVSLIAAVLFTFCFALFTGFQVSAVRASVMLTISLAATVIGRTYDVCSALCFSLVLFLFFRPYLITQSGFQLSFSAITGICISMELQNQGLFRTGKSEKCSPGKRIVNTVLTAFCVTLFTLPVIEENYYSVPLYSMFLNIIAVPLLGIVMVSGILCIFTGVLSAFLMENGLFMFAGMLGFISRISVAPGHYILWLYEYLCDLISKLPHSTVYTGKPESWRVILYVLFLLVSFMDVREEAVAWKNPVIPAFLAVLFVFSGLIILPYREKDEFYIGILDVGQGDCFHIHSGNTDILIDGGSQGYEKVGKNLIEPYFLSKRITSLDAVIISHADSDHINGVQYLLSEQCPVCIEKLILPAAAEYDREYDILEEATRNAGSLVYTERNMKLFSDSVELTCLYSATDRKALSQSNRQSSVFLLKYQDFRMLFTGDITSKEEMELVALYRGSGVISGINVLKCAHHGSKTATSEVFLKMVNPEYAVLSYRKGNPFGHPAKEVTDRLKAEGVKLLRTAEMGYIRITIQNNQASARTYIKEKEENAYRDTS